MMCQLLTIINVNSVAAKIKEENNYHMIMINYDCIGMLALTVTATDIIKV